MGPKKELSTVTAAEANRPARKFESAESKAGLGAIAAGSAQLFVALALIKNLLWGKPADAPQSPTEEASASGGSSRASDASQMDALVATPASLDSGDSQRPAESRGGQPTTRPLSQSGSPAEFFQPDAPSPAKSSLQSGPMPGLPRPSNDNIPSPLAAFGGGSAATANALSGGGGGGGGDKTPSDKNDPDRTPNRRDDNRAPVITGNVVLNYAPTQLAVIIGLSDLLQHAQDLDGDSLSIADLSASSGTVVANSDGTWTFTPEAGSYVDVTLTYVVTDGTARVAHTAILDAVADNAPTPDTDTGADPGPGSDYADYNIIDVSASNAPETPVSSSYNAVVTRGTSGNDFIIGRAGNDVIYALEGNDVVHSGAGDDIVFGGHGNDRLQGDAGADVIYGEEGDDTIVATLNDGDDDYDGGEGSDTLDITTSAASTTIDLVKGTAEGVEIGYDKFRNIENVKTGSGDDKIIVDASVNRIETGGGNDTISTSAQLFTGGENARSDGDDYFDGGEGNNTLDFQSTTTSNVVDMRAQTANGSETGNDQFRNIQNITGGSKADIIIVDDAVNTIRGMGGDDVFKTSSAAAYDPDLGHISDGDDDFDGGEGSDTFDVASTSTSNLIDLQLEEASGAEIGTDSIKRFENATGGSSDDVFIANAQANTVLGGAGKDTIKSSKRDDKDDKDKKDDGDDHFDGQDDRDTLDLSSTSTSNTVNLRTGIATGEEIGRDRIEKIENVIGGRGNDVLIANRDQNEFVGGGGDDTFVFQRVEDSSGSRGEWDRVRDFTTGDKIDLSGIDANKNANGHQSFVLDFNPANPATAQATGTIRYRYEQHDDREYTIIRAKTGNDDDDILQIVLDGQIELDQNDFLLSQQN